MSCLSCNFHQTGGRSDEPCSATRKQPELIRVVVKYPGHDAEVIEVAPSIASLAKILGDSVTTLFLLIGKQQRLACIGLDSLTGDEPFNLLHPTADVPIFGPVVWLTSDEHGEPQSFDDKGLQVVLDFINSLAPSGDTKDQAS